MNKPRLLKLVKLLRENAKNRKGAKFNLTSWGIRAENFVDARDKPVPVDCGTSACAFGLAAISGAFKRAGLSYEPRVTHGVAGFVEALQIIPTYKGFTEFSAARKFFDLPYLAQTVDGREEPPTSALFDPYYYPAKYRKGARGERYVANRIAKYVRTGKLPKDAYDR